MVVDLNAVDGSYPRNLTDWKGKLFYTADDGFSGTELWALWEACRVYLPAVVRR